MQVSRSMHGYGNHALVDMSNWPQEFFTTVLRAYGGVIQGRYHPAIHREVEDVTDFMCV